MLAIMTLDVLWGVFTRYLLESQASWSEELARFLLIWIGILGAAYASGQKLHLAIDLAPQRLNPRRQKRLYILIHLLVIFFAATVMIVGGLRLMYITQILEQRSAALQLPMTVVYAVLPLSGILIVVYKMMALKQLQKWK